MASNFFYTFVLSSFCEFCDNNVDLWRVFYVFKRAIVNSMVFQLSARKTNSTTDYEGQFRLIPACILILAYGISYIAVIRQDNRIC